MASTAATGASAGGCSTSGSDLWQRIQSVYHQALDSGALYKTDSTDELIEDGTVQFIVRVASSLRDKPKSAQTRQARSYYVLLCVISYVVLRQTGQQPGAVSIQQLPVALQRGQEGSAGSFSAL